VSRMGETGCGRRPAVAFLAAARVTARWGWRRRAVAARGRAALPESPYGSDVGEGGSLVSHFLRK
jgi:hypothetical protein